MSEVTPERLNPFLAQHFGPGETHLSRIGGGQSNPTFIVDHGARRMVLRKQPAGEILKGAHAIDREFRVMRALEDTDVPVPRALLFHEDAALLGTPFYLMDFVEGRVFSDGRLPDLSPAERREVY
ncbi:phosphotransferase family protein, partial [Paracoccus sp. MC1862]